MFIYIMEGGREGGREGGKERGRDGEKRETHDHSHSLKLQLFILSRNHSTSHLDRLTIQLTEHNPRSYNVDSKYAKHGAGDACKGRVQTVKVDVFGRVTGCGGAGWGAETGSVAEGTVVCPLLDALKVLWEP